MTLDPIDKKTIIAHNEKDNERIVFEIESVRTAVYERKKLELEVYY
jgi:hypothetical protein